MDSFERIKGNGLSISMSTQTTNNNGISNLVEHSDEFETFLQRKDDQLVTSSSSSWTSKATKIGVLLKSYFAEQK